MAKQSRGSFQDSKLKEKYENKMKTLVAKHLQIKIEMIKFLTDSSLQMTEQEILDELTNGEQSEKSKRISKEMDERARRESGAVKAGPFLLTGGDTELYLMHRYPKGVMGYSTSFKGRMLGKDLSTGDLEQKIQQDQKNKRKKESGKSKTKKKKLENQFGAEYEEKVKKPLQDLETEYKKLKEEIKKDEKIEFKDKKNINKKNAAVAGGITLVMAGLAGFGTIAGLGVLTAGVGVGVAVVVIAVTAIMTAIGYRVSKSRANTRRQDGIIKELQQNAKQEYVQNKSQFIGEVSDLDELQKKQTDIENLVPVIQDQISIEEVVLNNNDDLQEHEDSGIYSVSDVRTENENDIANMSDFDDEFYDEFDKNGNLLTGLCVNVKNHGNIDSNKKNPPPKNAKKTMEIYERVFM